MTLLLVDDEYLMVEALRKRIEERKIPELETILTAYSADQARKVYLDRPVDILVTDVAMPKEDGLSLVKWVKEQGFSSVNLLLTGHEDFDYARSAIQLQCFRYILKPVNFDELAGALRDAAARCLEQRAIAEERASAVAESDRIRQFWREMMSGSIHPDSGEIRNRLRQFHLPESYPEQDFCFTLLKVCPLHGNADDISQNLRASLLAEKIRELRPDFFITVSMRLGEYMLICPPPQGEDMMEILDRLLDSLTDSWPDNRYVFYNMNPMPGGAAYYIYELLQRCAASFIATRNAIIPEDDLPRMACPEPDPELPVERWSELLLSGRTMDISRELRSILFHEDRILTVRRLSYIYYDFLNMAFRVMAERHIGISHLTAHANVVEATSSPENLLRWAERIMAGVEQALRESVSSDSVIQEARNYILEHLSDPGLSRNIIADEIHISPDYLSFLFHRETGTVLSSYITRERIEASKKLLRTTQEPLQEIALAVGYADSTYFCKQFKKVTGQTPRTYRSSMKLR